MQNQGVDGSIVAINEHVELKPEEVTELTELLKCDPRRCRETIVKLFKGLMTRLKAKHGKKTNSDLKSVSGAEIKSASEADLLNAFRVYLNAGVKTLDGDQQEAVDQILDEVKK
jgi:hypothetical protein